MVLIDAVHEDKYEQFEMDHRRDCVNAAVDLCMLRAQGLLPKKAS